MLYLRNLKEKNWPMSKTEEPSWGKYIKKNCELNRSFSRENHCPYCNPQILEGS